MERVPCKRTWFAAPCVLARWVTEELTAFDLIAFAASLPYIWGHVFWMSINHVGSVLPVSTLRLLMETM